MRHITLNLGWLIAAAFLQISIACNKTNDPILGPTISGKWLVSYFWDKKDQTSHYQNYNFDFGANGSLTASKGQQSYSGTWKTGVDDSKNKFVIQFSGSVPSELSELEEDWLNVETSANLMHFIHVSGGNGDTDILKFTKQ